MILLEYEEIMVYFFVNENTVIWFVKVGILS